MIEQFMEEREYFYHLTGSKMRIYIPARYIDTSMCTIASDHIKVFGVLPVELLDINDKVIATEILNCPYFIELYSTFLDSKNNYHFFKDDTPTDYRFVTFVKGERIMKNMVVSNLDNVDGVLDYIIGAKIINYVKYTDLVSIFDRAMLDNNKNLKIPHICKELIVASVCRNPYKPEEEYGYAYAKNKKLGPREYRPASNREIVSRSSISSSISFEDMDSMIISGLNTTAYNKKTSDDIVSDKIIRM